MNQPKVSLKHSTVSGCLLSAAAWVLFAASPASAGVVQYNDSASCVGVCDQASFLGALQSNYYFENYNSGLTAGSQAAGPLTFSDSVYSYNVDAPGDLLYILDPPNGALSTTNPNVALLFTFSSNIDGVGGNFFLTDFPQNPTTGSFTIALSDGSSQILSVPGGSTFNGFIASGGTHITSLTVTTATPDISPDVFATVDNLYVGAEASIGGGGGGSGGGPGGGPGPSGATPEPASVALFLSGLAASAFRVYKKRTV